MTTMSWSYGQAVVAHEAAYAAAMREKQSRRDRHADGFDSQWRRTTAQVPAVAWRAAH